ncbi:hypothetical protein F5146DRAFT_385722 [Armillaria mellea]|nr:hypothetical protein F5146DRAFT_385722 [Armillaria mellea]
MLCTLLNVFIQTLLTRNVGIASVAYGLDPRSSRFCRRLGFYEFLPFIALSIISRRPTSPDTLTSRECIPSTRYVFQIEPSLHISSSLHVGDGE